MDTSEHISAFLDFLRTSTSDLHIATDIENESNAETQDILHAIEFGPASAKSSKLMKKLKGVRVKRRKSKDKIEVLTPVAKWAEENKTVINSLEQLLGKVRKAEGRIQDRTYMPRTTILDPEELGW